jgi:parvulin-like peptidyl-prolyl isomerase
MKLKTNVTGAQPDRTATFEESRDTIEKLLKEVEARKMLKDKSDDAYNKIAEIVSSNKGSFEDAASRLRFQVKKTDLFSKKDELKDLSDTQVIAYTASELKDREISKPLEIAKGFMILQVTERKDPDEESFKKEKDDYSKKVRDRKVDDFMGDRLKKLEEASKPAIKFEDIEKYYR